MKAFLLITLLFSTKAYSACIPRHEYYPMEGNSAPRNEDGSYSLGMYARMSPDGRYIMRSASGVNTSAVSIIELVKGEKGNSTRNYLTPLSNEAFAVQGTWRYLVNIGGSHYRFKDIIDFQKKAEPQFKGGHAGFYAVAAEIPGGNSKTHSIRSIAWPAGNGDTMGVGYLAGGLIDVSVVKNKAKKISSKNTSSLCSNIKKSEGTIYSLPMISPEGDVFAAMPQNPKDKQQSVRLYRIIDNHKNCVKIADLKVVAGKVAISYKNLNAVLFSNGSGISRHGNGIHFYLLDYKKMFTLDDPEKRIAADSAPGFARDGRIIYGATWSDCLDNSCPEKTGYIVSDPYQSEDLRAFKSENPVLAKNIKECITTEDVAATDALQQKIWNNQL